MSKHVNNGKKMSKETINFVEFFSGIGVTSMALDRVGKRLGMDFKCKATSEIEPGAIKAYQTLHGTGIPNYNDVTKIDFAKMWSEVGGWDFCSWTFPCTNISTAGDKSGFEEGTGNASSLFWELKRMFKVHKPKIMFLENVASILNQRNIATFEKIVKFFEDEGYFVQYGIFDAADYGIPQHRERLFMICTHGEKIAFQMPKKKALKFKLCDILEKDVEEHYYLGKLKNTFVNKSMSKSYEFRVHNPSHCEVAYTMTTRAGRISENFIFEKDLSSEPTIRINPSGLKENGLTKRDIDTMKIRSLTKRETMLLMGLTEEDIKKLEGFPKTTIYRLMGNAIVVDALEEFLYEFFKAYLTKHFVKGGASAKASKGPKTFHERKRTLQRLRKKNNARVFLVVNNKVVWENAPTGKKKGPKETTKNQDLVESKWAGERRGPPESFCQHQLSIWNKKIWLHAGWRGKER